MGVGYNRGGGLPPLVTSIITFTRLPGGITQMGRGTKRITTLQYCGSSMEVVGGHPPFPFRARVALLRTRSSG